MYKFWFFLAFLAALQACNVPFYKSYSTTALQQGPAEKIFVRIGTKPRTEDTMRDAMARIKASLIVREHDMSGGIFTLGSEASEKGVDEKLTKYQPAFVLDILPSEKDSRWSTVGEVSPDSVDNKNGRRYLAVLFRAGDKAPLWYTRLKRGIDIGGMASASMADGLLLALERDGWIRPEPKPKKGPNKNIR